jgi:hypothetical protein
MGPPFRRIRNKERLVGDEQAGVGVKATAMRSGAKDEKQEPVEDAAVTVTGTSE